MWEWNDGTDVLMHHGIKGQKWGIRRFQNPDMTYTAAGKERYSWASRVGHAVKERINKHKDNVYKSYKEEGYSNKKAKELTDNKIKLQKTLAIIGGVTVASLAAYGIYKYGKQVSADKIAEMGGTIVSGKTLQRVSTDDSGKLYDTFYAAYDNADKMKYRGMLGIQRMAQDKAIGGSGKVFKTTLSVVKDLKVPPESVAKKAFEDLYSSDYKFKNTCDYIKSLAGFNGSKDLYDAFNRSLVVHDNSIPGADKEWNKFYDKLKAMGYNALYDVNDGRGKKSYSGYNANAPLIVFDKSAVAVSKINELGKGKMLADIVGMELYENGKNYLALGGLTAGVIAVKKSEKNEERIKNEQENEEKKK